MAHLALGAVPRSVWVTLEDDLVDSVKPGDDVEIIGVVKRRWKQFNKHSEDRTEVSLCIKAVNVIPLNNATRDSFNVLAVEKAEAEFKQFWSQTENVDVFGRHKLMSYFCPQVYGLYMVKLAVAVVLAGGVEKVDFSGTRVRGEAHLLLVGDPGTGKSQLLKYAAQLRSRSVVTTGVGSTSAGLTVSASSEGGQWHLEAGALVLADGGLCCIDEFGCIRESDRASIHEAMEQQTLSVAKAGMVSKLQTRCSVLAACNPKGNYDKSMSLSLNTAIATPLLSRFDLVLTLIDSRNSDWDKQVSDYILNQRDSQSSDEELVKQEKNYWSTSKLRAYFSYIRHLTPHIGSEANLILSRYYQRQRQTDGADMARTTIRLLQSCVRLAQGHARLMMRSEVTTQDAVTAVLLLECSTESSASLLPGHNILHSTFPDNPLHEYQRQARAVLVGLGLNDIWERERIRLENLKVDGSREESDHVAPTVEEEQTDFTQVLRVIQKNKAPVIPAPEVKRKRRKKVVEKQVEKKMRTETTESDSDAENVNLCSTLLESSATERSNDTTETVTDNDRLQDLSPILKTSEKSVISEKTKQKLGSFRRIDLSKEKTSVHKSDSDKVKSSLKALALKIHEKQKNKAVEKKRDSDEDFELDLDF